MGRFAKVEENAIKRQAELTGEEFRLYCLIKFHTWNDSGICDKTLEDLAAIYRLDYANMTRRYKILRNKGWCKNTRRGIRPLMDERTVEFTILEDEKTVNSTVPTVNSTVSDCNNYSFEDEKTVNSTVPTVNSTVLFKRNIEPFKEIPNHRHTEAAAATAQSVSVSSIFSLEECLKYVEKIKEDGAPIHNPHALAVSIWQSGVSDLLIKNTLYPEPLPVPDPEDEDRRKNCPRCYGYGVEYVFGADGSSRGCRPNCKHLPLEKGEYLYKQMTENLENER